MVENLGRCRLKLSGCGKTLELEFATSASVESVIAQVAGEYGVGPPHVKLLYRGKVLSGAGSLEAAGIRDRTKLMVMHTQAYHTEKAAIEAMSDVRKRADDIDPGAAGSEELYTQLLCKLDAIDVSSSEWLRARRKAEIAHVASLGPPAADGAAGPGPA